MHDRDDIPWRRLIAEGIAIVASILLAFAIDAWWDRKQELRQADGLIAALKNDFEANQRQVEAYGAGAVKNHIAAMRLLEALRDAEIGDTVTVSMESIVSAVTGPTYSPIEATYQVAISSGQIDLIENVALRNTLARWRTELGDTSEDEILVRQIAATQIVPVLSRDIRLGDVYGPHIPNWFFGRQELPDTTFEVTVTAELENLIAQRIFYWQFVVGGLANIKVMQCEILELLDDGNPESCSEPQN